MSGFDGYIRVSRVMGREGPGYISPAVQREAIERWAAYRNAEIIAWHVDEDESGGTQDRPGLREAIRRVESGETQGIAFWRLNRFARNVAGAIEDIKRVQEAGGELVFVEEGIDGQGPFGGFLLTVLLAVATLERDNMVSGWETAKRRAVERGAVIGPTAFGYARSEDGTLSPGPDAVHMIEAFHLAAAQGPESALDYLSANAPGRTWTLATVRRALSGRVYLGESRNGESVNPTAHEPLVSRAIWEAAQSTPRRRKASEPFPLSGLAQCTNCGSPMVGGRAGSRSGPSKRTYRCSATLTHYRGARCSRGAHILAERLEGYVREGVRPVLAGLSAEVSDAPTDALTLAERRLVEAEAELDMFAADLTLRRALADRYHAHLDSRVKNVAEARAEYRSLAKDAHVRERISAEDILDGPLEQFSDLLRSILASVLVEPGRGNLDDRVRLVPMDRDLRSRMGALDDPQ